MCKHRCIWVCLQSHREHQLTLVCWHLKHNSVFYNTFVRQKEKIYGNCNCLNNGHGKFGSEIPLMRLNPVSVQTGLLMGPSYRSWSERIIASLLLSKHNGSRRTGRRCRITKCCKISDNFSHPCKYPVPDVLCILQPGTLWNLITTRKFSTI